MATQQTDALDLTCESAEKSDGMPDSLHPCLHQDVDSNAEMHKPSVTGEENLESRTGYSAAGGPAFSSANVHISSHYDAGENDLADLYRCFGAYAATAQYVEFAQEDDAHRASSRWPLLVELGAPCKTSNKNGESC